MRIYLDACSIIYLMEAASPFHEAASRRVSELLLDEGASLITSRLSRLECRVLPLRGGDVKLLEQYELFFSRRRVAVAEISSEVIERATELRALHEFRTPDAIHLATALAENAGVFVTGDKAFSRFEGIRVELLTEPNPQS